MFNKIGFDLNENHVVLFNVNIEIVEQWKLARREVSLERGGLTLLQIHYCCVNMTPMTKNILLALINTKNLKKFPQNTYFYIQGTRNEEKLINRRIRSRS